MAKTLGERGVFMKVATLEIPRQVFDTPAQDAFCEGLAFTPWHATEEHRPIGGVNRVRRVVYEAISTYRGGRGGSPRLARYFIIWSSAYIGTSRGAVTSSGLQNNCTNATQVPHDPADRRVRGGCHAGCVAGGRGGCRVGGRECARLAARPRDDHVRGVGRADAVARGVGAVCQGPHAASIG